MRSALLVVVMLLAACPGPKMFPDGGLNPAHPQVLCSTTRCTPGATPSGCEAPQECLKTGCDGGTCEGLCIAGSVAGVGASCDSNGCCTFTCGGIAGFACPAALPNCQASTACCDLSGPCSR